jgi:hypothetical protein
MMQGFRFEGREKAFGRIGVSAYGRWQSRLKGHGSHDSHANSRRIPRRNAYTPIPRHVSAVAGMIGATNSTLVPATNKAAAQYTRQSVTTGLIAGSDLVIVPISGVIKKYK